MTNLGSQASSPQASTDECGLAEPCETGDPQQTSAQSSAERELAEKHRPVLYLKEQAGPCDSEGEPYYPVAVQTVLVNPNTALLDDGANVKMAPSVADLYEKGSSFYLDFPGNPRKPGCKYEQDFKAITPTPPPIVYARIVREEGFTELALQYWLYFYLNDWNNNHESDWEFMQIVFEEQSAEEALASSPKRVVYSQHGGGERAKWSDDKLRKEGNRPVVYVASGSHALQFDSKKYLGKGEPGTGFGCDDSTGPSYRVDPGVRVIPHEISGPNDEFAWLTYKGRWGERQKGEFNGPTGPNAKTYWAEPLSWMERQRDTNVQVPEDSIGPNAADTFCDVVARVSYLLFQRGPYATLALLVGVVGAMIATSSRTRFRPVAVIPIPLRRRFGQMLWAAFHIQLKMGLVSRHRRNVHTARSTRGRCASAGVGEPAC